MKNHRGERSAVTLCCVLLVRSQYHLRQLHLFHPHRPRLETHPSTASSLAHKVICAVFSSRAREYSSLWIRTQQARAVRNVDGLQRVERNPVLHPLDQCFERPRRIAAYANLTVSKAGCFEETTEIMDIRIDRRHLIVVLARTAKCDDFIRLQRRQLCNHRMPNDSQDRSVSASSLLLA